MTWFFGDPPCKFPSFNTEAPVAQSCCGSMMHLFFISLFLFFFAQCTSSTQIYSESHETLPHCWVCHFAPSVLKSLSSLLVSHFISRYFLPPRGLHPAIPSSTKRFVSGLCSVLMSTCFIRFLYWNPAVIEAPIYIFKKDEWIRMSVLIEIHVLFVLLCSYIVILLIVKISWLVDWLVAWLVDYLAGWLVGWMAGWLFGCLVGWLTGWLHYAEPTNNPLYELKYFTHSFDSKTRLSV